MDKILDKNGLDNFFVDIFNVTAKKKLKKEELRNFFIEKEIFNKYFDELKGNEAFEFKYISKEDDDYIYVMIFTEMCDENSKKVVSKFQAACSEIITKRKLLYKDSIVVVIGHIEKGILS